MSLGAKLKQLREEQEMKQETLAQILGINRATISMYERNQRVPSTEILQKYTKTFNVSSDYLLGNTHYKSNNINNEKYTIPVYASISCGNPFVADENIYDFEDIDIALKSQGEHFGLLCRGDSMSPEFKDGDVAIIRKQSDIDSGQVAAVRINGDEATLKIVKKSEQGITLVAINPDVFLPQFYSNEEIINLPVEIIGRVIENRRKY
ncbi:HTH-type transcriptional regulator immR [Anaerococcus prevotii]|uniref:Transcriptional regulator, XRE family n=1 Tax=Anaerococcus prevotii (strain ATCC 9321 / DSM 20548 / JCM 6508 / NCTC 11806 / PC1) TaxID=525919 RepID=C7RH64_ANAPD|nr:LexA family transcriptional regulator [Anaerococcus prevotii]ACV28825.1 transcriptional regulator, XRE family [Anaerococcus prevotii DSM 20548]SUU94500.1 HTH-type transcriptional regulator immR [Anaerococcus prevotii]